MESMPISVSPQSQRAAFAAVPDPRRAAGVAYLLAAVLALAHISIDVQGDRAAAELTIAPAVVAGLSLRNRVLTGDALYCQRALCEQLRAAGGDYLFLVETNQPARHDAIALLFDPPAELHPRRSTTGARLSVVSRSRGSGRFRILVIGRNRRVLCPFAPFPALREER